MQGAESDETASPDCLKVQTHNSWFLAPVETVASSSLPLSTPLRQPSVRVLPTSVLHHSLAYIVMHPRPSGAADLACDMGLETSSELPW